MKLVKLAAIFILFFGFFSAAHAVDETMTITTFYPLPYGSYNDLHVSNKLGIGTTNPSVTIFTIEGAISHDESNVFYGNNASVATHIDLGTNSTTGYSGANYNYCTIGGGDRNIAGGIGATVRGGVYNNATGNYSAVSGGYINNASGDYSSIIGGLRTNATGNSSFTGGGFANTASGPYSVIIGGYANFALGGNATVGGGYGNAASGPYSTVTGGFLNNASGEEYSTVTGGYGNRAIAKDAIILGGYNNTAGQDIVGEAEYTVVAGGYNNTALGMSSAIGGGAYNTITGGNATGGVNSTIIGGYNNTVSGMWSVIGGGHDNAVSGNHSVIGGGQFNLASGYGNCSIAGGNYNTASGPYCTIAGGYLNTAGPSGNATVGGGYNNNASGEGAVITGGASNSVVSSAMIYSMIEGGQYNNVTTNYGYAAGYAANCAHQRSFLWGGTGAYCSSMLLRSFNVCASAIYFSGGLIHDVAEFMDAASQDAPQQAEIVTLVGTDLLGKTKISYDPNLLGVVSGKKTATLNLGTAQYPKPGTVRIPVSLAGRCYVKVCAESGTIELGDAITSSSNPGIGMKASKSGKIIGYSMEKCEFKGPKEIKEILIFVKLGSRLCPEDIAKLAKITSP